MRKTWILIGIIMIITTIGIITATYSKYSTSGSGQIEKTAGAWVIKINDTDVSGGNTITNFLIDNLTYTGNQYVAQNKIAPTSNGYFEIEIDPTGCSTAVRYDITLDTSALTISNSINFKSAYIVNSGVESSQGITRTDVNTYTGVISLSDVKAETPSLLRFYIEWEDDGTGAHDSADSALGLTKNVSIAIPVQATISQYQGEEITEYE